ncbi:unnamed protein product [marine sediment metagenome]|uniref:Outer membrane protein beta-barrel domain-containing protein n=1 Tax=marine sediment metagenome TaxID=412755 RepID=X1AW18_9ZZZZ
MNMKTFLGLVLVLFSFGTYAEGNYAGVGVGSTDFESNDGTFQDDATGGGIFVGTRMLTKDRFSLDAEAGLFYTAEGDDSVSGDHTTIAVVGDSMVFNAGVNAGVHFQPSENIGLNLYIPVGYSLWDGEISASCSRDRDGRERKSSRRQRCDGEIGDADGDDSGVYYGIGLQADWGSKFFTRVSYIKYDIDFGGIIDDPERIALDLGFKF